jgi:hypothetical protein
VGLLRPDQFSDFDIAIDGWGYVLTEGDDPSPFQFSAPDDALEKTSIDTLLEQNKLDTLYWDSNRSWHEGAGQTRLDVPPRFVIDPTTASSPYKFLRSKGVDITTKGQLTLLHRTVLAVNSLNADPIPQKLAATDQFAYLSVGNNSLYRFAALDGSDQTSIGNGSATSAPVLDFASDGGNIYAALGAEGISRATVPTQTQINAADALTNWAGSSATLTLNSSNKKEGTNAINVAVNNAVTGTATLTFGSAQDYSAKDQFSIWINAPASITGTGSSSIEVRFITSGGNYYRFPGIFGSGGWQSWSMPRVGGFTAVGSPAWNNINSLAVLVINATGSAVNVLIDDLEALVGTAFALWETSMDARVIAWANDQLYAAGIKTGTQWRFFKAAAGSGSAEVYVIPDGWVVTSIRALGGLVYFSAYRGSKGVVYAYDGVNAPTVACPPEAMGIGTIPLSLIPFSGAGMLIGCRRIGTNGGQAGTGVLHRGFPDATGALRVERLAILGVDDGRDYGIRCGIAWGDSAYFGWNYGDEPAGENFLVDQNKRSGLGIYIPETGGYSRSYLTPSASGSISGVVEDVAVFKGRRMFTVGGQGVCIEQTTYEPEGAVQSSLLDINVSADKIWLAQETYYSATEAIPTPVAHAYSIDGSTWLNDTGGSGAGSSIRMRTSFNALGLKTPSLYGRTRLLTTSGTVTPVVYQTGIGGYPATKPLPVHAMMIRAYPSSERLDIARTHMRHDGYAVLARLIALWQNQSIVDYQPPWAFADGGSGISYRVRVAEVQADKGWNASGDMAGGTCAVKLKVVP